MNNIVPTNDIPKIIDDISKMIFEDEHAKDEQSLLKFLNLEPKNEWIREMNGIKYIPIGIIESLMQRIFGKVIYEVREWKLVANSICVCVRTHYRDPITKEMLWSDGVGAIPIQISKDKGQGAIDFANMNSKAVQMGLPAAKSFAIKDSCEHIGRIFGRDISRKDNMEFAPIFTEPVKLEEVGFSKNK